MVIGVADSTWGGVGHAVIVLKDGRRLDTETVRERCAERLAKFKMAKHVSFTDEIFRSGQG